MTRRVAPAVCGFCTFLGLLIPTLASPMAGAENSFGNRNFDLSSVCPWESFEAEVIGDTTWPSALVRDKGPIGWISDADELEGGRGRLWSISNAVWNLGRTAYDVEWPDGRIVVKNLKPGQYFGIYQHPVYENPNVRDGELRFSLDSPGVRTSSYVGYLPDVRELEIDRVLGDTVSVSCIGTGPLDEISGVSMQIKISRGQDSGYFVTYEWKNESKEDLQLSITPPFYSPALTSALADRCLCNAVLSPGDVLPIGFPTRRTPRPSWLQVTISDPYADAFFFTAVIAAYVD